MQVSYGIVEPDNTFEPCDTFEIALAMREEGDSIWICVDGTPLDMLPKSFNRLVVGHDGSTLLSAVLETRELVPLEGEEDKSPLPSDAPLLIIDHEHEAIQLVISR